MKQTALNRAYYMCFSTPDGKKVLEDLERRYDRANLIKKVNGVVDPNAVLVAASELGPITHIKERIKDGRVAR